MAAEPVTGAAVPTAGAVVHPAWPRAAAGWLFAVALLSWVAAPVWGSMVTIWWRSGTFNHALAVPPIVAWLVWRARDRWQGVEPRPDRRWWPPLVCGGVALAVAEAALLNAPSHLALVATIALTVPALLGPVVARQLAFPIGYAFFMVPIGEFLVPWMMEATATFTVWALQLSGVPVYREGLDFIIPSGHWSVVEACSGIRYLIASVTVGSLFAYLSFSRTRHRLAFVGVSIVVPVVANWLRAYLIVMLGHLTDNRLAAGVDHLVYGWLFFGLVMALMFMVGIRWADPPSTALMTARVSASRDADRPATGISISAAVPAVTVLVAAPLLLMQVWRDRDEVPTTPPAVLAGWDGPVPSASTVPWPAFDQSDRRERFSYAATSGAPAALEVMRVSVQRQTLLHRIPVGEGPGSPQVVEVPGSWPAAAQRWMLVQRLRIDGRWWTPGMPARLALARVRLTGRPDLVEAWVWALPLAQGLPAVQAASEEAARRALNAVVAAHEIGTGPRP